MERTANIFTPYVRRAFAADGLTFYVIPEISQSPFTGQTRDGAALLALGKAEAHGGADPETVAEIKQVQLTGTLRGGVPPTLVEGIVPDGVASVTLSYAAGKAGGFSHKTLPAATVTTRAINNVIVAAAPRAGLQTRVAVATWRATNGTILKVVHGTAQQPWWRTTPTR